VIVLATVGCGSSFRRPSIRIVSPQRPSIRIVHSSVIGAAVILKVKITGWKMAPPHPGVRPKPDTGQWQIFADDTYFGYSYDRTYGTINGLSGGTHQIWVALARTDYSLVYPLIRSRPVTIRIADDARL
jgi:hypothetical protein